MCGWMANLWQELQDGSGVQCANGKSDEKGEHILHIVCLHERHDEDSGEWEGTDHCHTQERKAPHWWFEWEEGWLEEESTTLKQTTMHNVHVCGNAAWATHNQTDK